MAGAPLTYRWSGDAWVVHPRFQRQADAAFTIGETRTLVEVEERSEASHKQEFAWLREAWLTLPDSIATEYPSPEHLRKRALIRTGWCTMTDYVCGSNAEAMRWATNLRKEVDEYALVIVERTVVRVLRPKSQSRKAMGKADFEASKADIIRWIADLIEVEPATLARQSEAA